MPALFSQGDGAMTLRELIEQFCIKRLAEVLWQCVACSDANRAELDWLTAENFVKKHPPMIDNFFPMLVSQMGAPNCPPDLPIENANGISYNGFVELCGKAVWDYFYQPLKAELKLPHHPVPHYTHVRYG